jgi:ectoine hydroxylase-related dioxygenase (phytanoyl-CoA dioxygenase family)
VGHLRKWTEIAIETSADPSARRDAYTAEMRRQAYIIETRLAARFDGFRDFALNSRCGEAAAACLGSQEVRLFNDTIFVKEPSAISAPTPWHQDQHAFNLGGTKVCAIWIALDPVTEASGAMTYALGSHRWGKEFTLYTHPNEPFDGPPPDVDAHPELYPTASFDLEPGDAVFHHLMTLHKAGPNTTAGTRRRGYSIRFAGDGTYWFVRMHTTASIDTKLKSGEPLKDEAFPVLWPR